MTNKIFCPVEHTIRIIGGKWKSIILWHLNDAKTPYRYGEIKKLLPNINHKVLSQQLKELQSANLIKRQQFNVIPPKVEYSISKKGESLAPILNLMHTWGSQDMPNE